MSTITDNQLIRVKDEQLRLFATSSESGTAAVTIELDLPFPQVELARGGLGTPFGLRPRKVIDESVEEVKAAQEIERVTRRAIERIIENPVTWLELGKAGFTRVSVSELQQLLEVGGIRFIHPRRD